jgi:hypothetical protein
VFTLQCKDDASAIPSVRYNFVAVNQLPSIDKDTIVGASSLDAAV